MDTSSFATIIPSVVSPSAKVFSPNLAAGVSPFFATSARVSYSAPSLAAITIFKTDYVELFGTSIILPFRYTSDVFPAMVDTGVVTTSSGWGSYVCSVATSVSPFAYTTIVTGDTCALCPGSTTRPDTADMSVLKTP